MTTPDFPDEIRAHYETVDESQRIASGLGRLELERTREIMRRWLPDEPQRVLDVLLSNPDPKIGVFSGGLRDPDGTFRSYKVVGADGELTERQATYDGSKLYLYVPANESRVIARLRELQEQDLVGNNNVITTDRHTVGVQLCRFLHFFT